MHLTHLLRVTCLAAGCAAFATPPQPTPDYGKLPLSFQPNVGQTSPQVDYVAQGRHYTIFFTPQNTTLTLRKDAHTSVALRFSFADAAATKPVAESPLASVSNFYTGSSPANWKTNVPNYSRIRYASVYPGTDAIFYGNGQKLEYDLEVAPNADPSRIRISVAGADKISLDSKGDLVITAAHKSVVFHRPVSYQTIAGARRDVTSAFRLNADHTIGFSLGAYDHSQALVIDPTLLYSTYVGGGGSDGARALAVDGSGNAYLAGYSGSADYPQSAGAFSTPYVNFYNVAVTKLNSSGTAAIYSTQFGGNQSGGDSIATGIAVDSAGNAYVTGSAQPGLPTTAGVVQPTSGQYGGGFVVKLSPTGQLVWSTYVGNNVATPYGIALDSSNNVYVAGAANAGLPVTANAFQKTYAGNGDAFVLSLNPAGTAYRYVTYLGGGYPDQANGIAVDYSGAAYVTGVADCNKFPSTPNAYQKYCDASGQDIFVAKLDPTGSSLVYGTFLHAPGGFGTGIALDSNLNAYVTGNSGAGMPTSAGAFQPMSTAKYGNPIVVKINASGSALLYGTYLGGSDYQSQALAIKVDPSGNAYVTGQTGASDFPVTSDAYQNSLHVGQDTLGTALNAFVSVVNSNASQLLYSTYYGNTYIDSYGIALDNNNNIYIDGQTGGPGTIPVTSGAFQTTSPGGSDLFAAKFSAITNGGGGGGCLPSGPGAKICQPTNGSSVTSPFTFQAGATAASGNITAIRVYDNNTSVLTVNNSQATQSFQINQQLNLSVGSHNIVVVAYQSTGGAQTASENITVQASGGGCSASSPGVNICKPSNGANVASPVEVQAAALASTGNITAIRVYDNNVSIGTFSNPSATNSFQIDQSFTLASGSHHIVVVAYQSNGGAQTNSVTITVP